VQNTLFVQALRSPILTALLHCTLAAGSAKLCGVVRGIKLRNFRRGCHLYSARRPLRWYRPTVKNEQLVQVNTFPYLGSLITEDGECTTEFRTRLNRGQAIRALLQKIWKGHISIPISTKIKTIITMAALWNRAGHYIFVVWFLFPSSFFILSFFFPRLISAIADWMSTIFVHMVWP